MNPNQNELITRVGPGTAAGALLRNYWQPAAITEELDDQRPVKAIRLLGEDFVLFRDDRGKYGMLDRHCAHRGADLAFGRLEDGGLRCSFHGWLFDVTGRCLEAPAEPANSRLCARVCQKSYPVSERNGILFAWLGNDYPSRFPDFDCFVAPPEYTFAFKGFLECNWLQALEVGIDPAHASYLHRFFRDEDLKQSYGKQFRGASSDSAIPITKVLREHDRPSILVESTDYGLQLIALRRLNEVHTHVRVTNVLFPQAFVIPMSPEMTISQWHVPIDDTHCYWYAIFTSFGSPVDKTQMRDQRLELYELPNYKPRRNRLNNYGFDPEEQRNDTYTGMGHDINVHDQWAIESQGPIHDRSKEHLGTSDRGIIAYRRMLLEAIEKNERGEKTTMMLTEDKLGSLNGPVAIDGIASIDNWKQYSHEADAERRRRSPWHFTPSLP